MEKKITALMLRTVLRAMEVILSQKGQVSRMMTAEEIEEFMFMNDIKEYIPVLMCLRNLIEQKYVRYFKKTSGQLTYGFTKSALEQLGITTPEQVEKVDYDALPVLPKREATPITPATPPIEPHVEEEELEEI